jgi:4-hydroxybenzoate polyprenyltransferase
MTDPAVPVRRPGRFETAASFVRLSALGVTAFLPFLGAASSATRLSPAWQPITAIVLVAVAFHVYAYVGNDVVDLPIDRTAPARWCSPLVLGTVRPVVAAAVAAAQVPIAMAATWWGGGGLPGLTALLAACALMLAYNVWGKRTPMPPVTDLVQGLGWAAFTMVGVFIAGRPGPATGWLLAFIAVYIVLANGVHGSIRDIRNDLRHRVRTTALMLGARPGPGRNLSLPTAVVRYALSLQAILTCLALAARIGARSPAGTILVAVVAATSFALLRVALRCTTDERLLWSTGALHLIATLLLPLTFLLDVTPRWLVIALLAFFVAPFLVNGWLREALRWAWWRNSNLLAPSARDDTG